MPPNRSASAPETAALLVSVMKDNAELKSALEVKSKDVQAAEHALVLLVEENQALGKEANEAREDAEMVQRRLKHTVERLEDAEDDVERLKSALRERDRAISRLEEENAMLTEANEHLSRRREDQDRYKERNATQQPSQARISRFSAPKSDKKEPGEVSWPSPAVPPPPYSSSPTLTKPSFTLDRNRTLPSTSTRWNAEKPANERTILNQYMYSLPLPSNLRMDKFDEANAVERFDSADTIYEDFPSSRPPLFLPGRMLWVPPRGGYEPRGGHALAYAPTHEYIGDAWREHTHLTSLASREVDLFFSHHERLYYAGVYRVLSLRGVTGYTPGGELPTSEISQPALFRAMHVRQHAPEDVAKLRRNPAFGDGRPTVECFGLQFLRYDDRVRDTLCARFAGAAGRLQDRIGGKRRWDEQAGEGEGATGKKAKSDGKLYENKVWVRPGLK
ncbi:hypothetical protein MIND_01153400 [Mycena indigotica]|uniref:Uncharacterized protein n=1 Tax=Mycena indigotica TaxID=2126181 RepID=A0A8H6VUM2_9AGAR|nr:uncharacterized protein MIND_01153400 [Mycena indigotica]KAF7292561.1 hypothetical protein MIND_01153400 [Mycena indigotica]